MRITQKRSKEVEVTIDVVCDRCGISCTCSEYSNYRLIGDREEGWEEFDLCLKCYDYLVKEHSLRMGLARAEEEKE